jgi:hypothetical protein
VRGERVGKSVRKGKTERRRATCGTPSVAKRSFATSAFPDWSSGRMAKKDSLRRGDGEHGGGRGDVRTGELITRRQCDDFLRPCRGGMVCDVSAFHGLRCARFAGCAPLVATVLRPCRGETAVCSGKSPSHLTSRWERTCVAVLTAFRLHAALTGESREGVGAGSLGVLGAETVGEIEAGEWCESRGAGEEGCQPGAAFAAED